AQSHRARKLRRFTGSGRRGFPRGCLEESTVTEPIRHALRPVSHPRERRALAHVKRVLPWARKWASTETLAARNFWRSSNVTWSHPYSSSLAQRRKAGGASAGMTFGGWP